MIYRYPPEVHEFVKIHCREMRDEKLAEATNAALGTSFTKASMRAFRGNHGYKNGLSRGLYVDEIHPEGLVEYIRKNSWGVSSAKMAEKVNEIFGTSFTQASMKQFRQRHGIKSGVPGWYQKGHPPANKGKRLEDYLTPEKAKEVREKISGTQFKKGQRPRNELPVGSVVFVGGYLLRKKQERGSQWERWEFLHRAVWEEHHGPIPEGMVVTFRDSNPKNCSIENLMLITRGEAAALTRKGYRFEDPDLTDAALAVVRVSQAADRIRKKKRRTS